jgi:hypothetical protein
MPQRKSFVSITILFSIVVLPLAMFLAGGRRVCAGTKDTKLAAPNGTRLLNQAAAITEARFAIYLVKYPANEHSAERMALRDLVLEEQPVLTEEDITSYRISPDGRHFIRLKSGVKARVASPAGGTLLNLGFVVVADGSRIYLGGVLCTNFINIAHRGLGPTPPIPAR